MFCCSFEEVLRFLPRLRSTRADEIQCQTKKKVSISQPPLMILATLSKPPDACAMVKRLFVYETTADARKERLLVTVWVSR